ncbi:MAG: anti-sigma factor domain-containing protein, partial [Oscillospiraceae bacterium]
MKAVIVELKEKFAAALADDGSFIKIKNDNYSVGQQIEVHKWSIVGKKLSSHIASLAAGFVFTCILGYGTYAYMTPESYVSLDVNPSIEYTLNRFERVLDAQAVNEDGSRVLEKINLKKFSNKTIDEVMALTIEEITREGYFAGEMPGGIVIATWGKTTHSAQEMA